MRSDEFEAFQTRLMERHVNPLTRSLSTVGDVFWLASVPAGVATRNWRVFGALFLAGTVIATGAHLFQPGTVNEELASVVTHPIWASRAEFARVFRRR